MKQNFNIVLFSVFLVVLYLFTSLFEWLSHYYFMHFNGFIKPLFTYFNINLENSHIEHHKEAKLNQTLPDNFIEEGLVFNTVDGEILLIFVFLLLSVCIFWHIIPVFRKSFSLTFLLTFSFVFINIYAWIWSSIHSHYHGRYINANTKLKNNPNITIYSPVSFFVPEESWTIYKLLFWYHILHHLNKGQDKYNYNIIFPFFDFVFGTYKNKVDNRIFFSKHEPKTKQEMWLKEHPIFYIRVLDHNVIEYKDEKTDEWIKLPSEF